MYDERSVLLMLRIFGVNMNIRLIITSISLLVKFTCSAQQCQDMRFRKNESWVDSMGFSCELYEGANWCTPSKGYGNGWDISSDGREEGVGDNVCQGWGRFKKFKNPVKTKSGLSAMQACCGCGGGIRNSTNFSNELPIYTGVRKYPYANNDHHFSKEEETNSNCYNCKENQVWHDSCGYSCLAYYYGNFCTKDGKTGRGWNIEDYGPISSYKNGGKDAFEACGACKQN